MQFIERKHIDIDKWNAKVASSNIENIFCYSWYLDATAKNWGALVSKDYNTILPIPYSTKLGQKQIYQPAFTRELDIHGDEFTWQEALSHLSKDFKAIQFRNSSDQIFKNPEKRIHQLIDLNSTFKLSTNAKRLVKKAGALYTAIKVANPERLIALFKATAFNKIDSISENDLLSLTQLMNHAIESNHCEIIEIAENNETIAAACFLKDKERITYLKGSATEEAKKNGAMYYLINSAIEEYKTDFKVFDFGGSDIENVANFYKKFGATDRTYYNYSLNNLPAWFKALKRIKK